MAEGKGILRTPFPPDFRISFARAWIRSVISGSAGPPDGGLYLKPPSSGGLWEGVITTPSARPDVRPLFHPRMAWEITGVGVYPPPCWTTVSPPLAAKTSTAVRKAGSERAWVSFPTNRGPVIPFPALYSAMAWETARMCASLKDPFREDPLCPDVPKETSWRGLSGSGCSV